jgi:hypothetical protein
LEPEPREGKSNLLVEEGKVATEEEKDLGVEAGEAVAEEGRGWLS